MKCLTIHEPGRCSLGETSEPIPSNGEVLLGIRRVGFCGSDLSTFRGANPLVSYPRIPGHEIAAEILSTGTEVPDEFRPGMTVTVLPYTACGQCSSCRSGRTNACRNNRTLGVQQDGAMTERIVLHWSKLVAAPGLSLAELALVEPLAVGFHAVSRGRVAPSDTVLVFGCGMVGLGAIAAAGLRIGARVIAVDIDDAKLEVARKAGASLAINSRTENLHQRVLELTGGEGPHVVVEAVGNPDTFRAAVEEVCFAGRVVYIGYAKAPVSYETKLFVMKELDILGSRNATRADFMDVVALLSSGRYPVSETISRTVPLLQAGDALAAWSAQPASVTRIHVEL